MPGRMTPPMGTCMVGRWPRMVVGTPAAAGNGAASWFMGFPSFESSARRCRVGDEPPRYGGCLRNQAPRRPPCPVRARTGPAASAAAIAATRVRSHASRRRSRMVTVPRSVCDRIRRPTACASRKQASGTTSSRNGLRPQRCSHSARACSHGCAGTANGRNHQDQKMRRCRARSLSRTRPVLRICVAIRASPAKPARSRLAAIAAAWRSWRPGPAAQAPLASFPRSRERSGSSCPDERARASCESR